MLGKTCYMFKNRVGIGLCSIIKVENFQHRERILKAHFVAVAYKSSPIRRGQRVFKSFIRGVDLKGDS